MEGGNYIDRSACCCFVSPRKHQHYKNATNLDDFEKDIYRTVLEFYEWTGYLRKRSWPNLRYCYGIFLEGLRKATKNVRIADLGRSSNANRLAVTLGHKHDENNLISCSWNPIHGQLITSYISPVQTQLNLCDLKWIEKWPFTLAEVEKLVNEEIAGVTNVQEEEIGRE
jgi:hypothetical protein